MSTINALISWPSAPLTDSLVRRAIAAISLPVAFISQEQLNLSPSPLLQWSTYDHIDHELVHCKRDSVLSSSYIFRKALIRKHYLSYIIQSYTKKYPDSILHQAFPRTFQVEISFADELDEMWTDELWELGEDLDSGHSGWILKPGMADRGMGIRIFHSKENLQQIFEEFEHSDSEDGSETQDVPDTSVVTSQLRHFVIQEYIDTPLLLDPSETLEKGSSGESLSGRKFHLRVYCVAKGNIQLYVYKRILALFSSMPYLPLSSQSSDIDLKAHLTNTSLQTELGDSNVRLLDELQGCHILSDGSGKTLTSSDIAELVTEISTVLADVFRAASQNPVHFQPLPNAFELYGVDFLVCHTPEDADKRFHVKILELNSEPAIELTGPRLTWILEDLFESIAKVCVEPFFSDRKDAEPWIVSEVKHNLLKCMDENIRSPET
ncbi:tubulin-tyrosine ligase [Gymnopilus junonius]|uniref:Tubulin-tyrosine ligase n=1 Tax=Gymnopilus junonius TaxID=109634 RepID=A0A9P5NXH3_GYMJU|nr:tubulin-tyrosine ligase [Gymnopilus junonius]